VPMRALEGERASNWPYCSARRERTRRAYQRVVRRARGGAWGVAQRNPVEWSDRADANANESNRRAATIARSCCTDTPPRDSVDVKVTSAEAKLLGKRDEK
jgi:hypothetical protein